MITLLFLEEKIEKSGGSQNMEGFDGQAKESPLLIIGNP